jgi:hypothetical protein
VGVVVVALTHPDARRVVVVVALFLLRSSR